MSDIRCQCLTFYSHFMDSSKKDEKITIRLPADIKDKLKMLAKKNNRKLSDFIFLELVRIVEAQDQNTQG